MARIPPLPAKMHSLYPTSAVLLPSAVPSPVRRRWPGRLPLKHHHSPSHSNTIRTKNHHCTTLFCLLSNIPKHPPQPQPQLSPPLQHRNHGSEFPSLFGPSKYKQDIPPNWCPRSPQFLNLLTFGLWGKLGRLTHYAFDAVLSMYFPYLMV